MAKNSIEEIKEVKSSSKTGAETIEDLGPDKESQGFKLGITTITLGILLLIVSIMFFYLLSSKTGADFGLTQIIFAITVALISTALLRWVKFFMTKNPYLGLVIGLLVLGSSIYSLRLKFIGPNTNTFSVIIALIVLAYLFIHFWKGKNKNT
jgi:hypothetical protein